MKAITRYCVDLTVTSRYKGVASKVQTRNVYMWAHDPDDAVAGARALMREAMGDDFQRVQVNTCKVAEIC